MSKTRTLYIGYPKSSGDDWGPVHYDRAELAHKPNHGPDIALMGGDPAHPFHATWNGALAPGSVILIGCSSAGAGYYNGPRYDDFGVFVLVSHESRWEAGGEMYIRMVVEDLGARFDRAQLKKMWGR